MLLVFLLTLILGFKTVPSAITRYPYEIHAPMGGITKADLDFAPPLQTAGRHIVDANGKRYKLASINWYGGSDIFFVPMGLDVRHRSDIAKTIKKMGFNSVRFPYSDQMEVRAVLVDRQPAAKPRRIDGRAVILVDRKPEGARLADVVGDRGHVGSR